MASMCINKAGSSSKENTAAVYLLDHVYIETLNKKWKCIKGYNEERVVYYSKEPVLNLFLNLKMAFIFVNSC